jgi:hypothetical protein
MNTKIFIRKIKIVAILTIFITIVSCRKQPIIPPAVVNEPENITTVKIELKDSANVNNIVTAQWRDLDGAGGNNPVIEAISLQANKTYFATITILDETKSPVSNISDEVKEEGDQHQFFFKPTNANVSVKYNDADANGNPIGLNSKWRTTTSSTGTITVILKHQPGVKVTSPGDINAGETDLEVNYPISINN